MHCPKCNKKIPDNLAFCGNCGKQLPKVEINPANANAMPLEKASNAAQGGFDTGKQFLANGGTGVPPVGPAGPVETNDSGIWITFFIVAMAIIMSLAMMGGDGGGFGGTTRSCVVSATRARPSCSDNNGLPERTLLNGRDLGICRVPSNSGCAQR
jgi:hypothetical protein